MSDEVINETDVKDSVADSSAADNHVESATPPTEENSGANKQENRIPQSRLNEVIEQREEARIRAAVMEQKLRDYEARLSAEPKKDDGAAELDRLVKSGVDPKVAREIMEVNRISNERANAPIREAQRAQELSSWNRNMAQKYNDYDAVVPEMEKVFSSLSKQEQMGVMSGPRGLEMLYHQAKASKVADTTKAAFDSGKKAAYDKKSEKMAVSGTPGQGSKGSASELSAESIRDMSIAEYKKRLPEINDWLSGKKRS